MRSRAGPSRSMGASRMCIRSADHRAVVFALVLGGVASAQAQNAPTRFDFGAPASTDEIAAVAIAIAPDGAGLPPGKGDYATGKQVYENACAACHGADLKG